MGQRYSQRPSDWLGLDDEWLAFQVDLYIAEIASQASPDKPTGGKPQEFSDNPADYVDPQLYVKRRVKVNADGTWED